jgi:hypothetical protein
VFCHVYAQHEWTGLEYEATSNKSRVRIGTCGNCSQETVWWVQGGYFPADTEDPDGLLLWPIHGNAAPGPHNDMPEDVKADYEEARTIAGRSPRGAAALLRLAVQKLMVDLGESGKDINRDIGSLVQKGLPVEVQQALDAVRVVGNEAVHPGKLNLNDDADTAVALFSLLNFIVDQRIAQPKKLQALYNSLPPAKLAGIQQRDSSSS